MYNKVHKGTRSGKRLCDTCKNATIMRGAAESQEFISCSYVDRHAPINVWEVIECSEYKSRSQVDLRTMQDVAWILDPSSKERGHFGFLSPDEYKTLKKEKGDVLPPRVWEEWDE